MSAIGRRCLYPIRQVLVYDGHQKNPLLGPYYQNIEKRIQMFKALNPFRKELGRPPWEVKVVSGEEIVEALQAIHKRETLLVIPAGQSTHLDQVFAPEQTASLNDFFHKGGRGYFTCGSAYWVSSERVYSDLCSEQTQERKTIVKKSALPLFMGRAKGPLCPYPGQKYQVGFYSDAVRVTSGDASCTIFLSGGGSFILEKSDQRIEVLVRYPKEELLRLQKPPEECPALENAALLVSTGEGGAVLSMFHPYYGSQDIDVELYERQFPDCGTDWKVVHAKLSPFDQRMRFVLNSMLLPLEDLGSS